MKRSTRISLAALAVLGMPLFPAASGGEIPGDLDQRGRVPGKAQAAAALERAGLPAKDAGARAEAMDPAERAALARSDAAQRGGEHEPEVVTVVVVVLVVVLLLILL